MLLWWRRYKHRVELSDTRRDNHHRRVTSTLSKDSQIARWFIGADARAMAAQTAIREWAVTDEAAFHERAIAPLSIIVPRCWPP